MSAVTTHRYDPTARTLHVTYSHGAAYVYHDVPPHVFAAAGRAPSLGKFLVDHVKGKYRHTKPETPP